MSDKYGFAFVAWASNLDVGGARRQLQVVDDIGFDEMSAVGKTFDVSIGRSFSFCDFTLKSSISTDIFTLVFSELNRFARPHCSANLVEV